MAATAPEVTELAEGLQRTLAKLVSVLRRGDSNANREAAGELTLAQLSILVTLLETGPIRVTAIPSASAASNTVGSGCQTKGSGPSSQLSSLRSRS